MNYVTKVAAKSTDKKASEIGILINASSLNTAGGRLYLEPYETLWLVEEE